MLRPVPKERRDDGADETAAAEQPGIAESPRLARLDPKNESKHESFEPVIAPQTVGGILTVTRMKFGQDLRQVSQALRIRQGYLEAIEQDRHSDLPGLPYAVGFVRSYADYLGLEGKTLVARYKEEAQGLNRKPNLVFPSPVQEGKVPTGAIILVSLILLGLAYAGWTYFSRETAPPPATVAAPPSEPATPSPAPSAVDANASEAEPAPAPAATPEAPVAGTGGASAPASPAPGGSLGGPLTAPLPANGGDMATPGTTTTSAPAAVESAAPAIPAAPPAPAVAGTVTDPAAAATTDPAATQEAALPPVPVARVIILAKQDSWVQIRDDKDQAIVTRVLREGESYEVPDQAGLVLLTGNAGGLVITVDGKALPPLGAVGAVKRNVALDPDKLLPVN